MGYCSTIPSNIPIYGDGFDPLPDFREFQVEGGFGTGYVPRNYLKEPYGSLPYTIDFPLPIIPENEWPDRIQDLDNSEFSIEALLEMDPKIPTNDQARSSTCWAQSAVKLVEVERRVQIPDLAAYVKLSPGFVAGPVNNYRDIGGWPGDAIKFIAENGVCPASLHHPNDATHRASAAAYEAAKAFKVLEWIELSRRNFAQQMTLLLNRKAYAAGYGHMGHAMLAIAPKLLGPRKYGILNLNSWGEANRFMILAGSKAVADDGVSATVISPH